MQVVSKWHTTHRNSATGSNQVERVLRLKKQKSSRHQHRSAKPHQLAKAGIDGHSLIATQIVATRLSDAYDLNFSESNHIEGARVYDAALDRKIHRMDQGSFYQETL